MHTNMAAAADWMYNLLPLHAGHITKIDGKHSLLLLAPCACSSQREAATLWLTWHCLLGHPVPTV